MLVLSRKCGETLRIGSDVRITVVAASGRQVRLAIEAPETVAIYREEVWERIRSANLEAAHCSPEQEPRSARNGANTDKEARSK